MDLHLILLPRMIVGGFLACFKSSEIKDVYRFKNIQKDALKEENRGRLYILAI